MLEVAVIDYGNGNLGSLLAALGRLDVKAQVLTRASDAAPGADAVIFPGVGALGTVVQHLETSGLRALIERHLERQRPILGICLGMQLFFEEGAEGGSGLGWLKGSIPELNSQVLPHIGWNTVQQLAPHTALTVNIPQDPAYYFVHSYRILPANPDIVAGITEYEGEPFPSVIVDPPLYGVQFHPELSGHLGHRLLAQWLEEVR
ncbi:MAG: imidazole glycerol phosphate synthase subunit HisH [Sulfobacillus sp.]